MKSIQLTKKFTSFVIGFVALIFISILFLTTIKVEYSVKTQLVVDNNNDKNVLIDSNLAYKINKQSTVILHYNDEYKKVYIDSMESVKSGNFKLKLKIEDEKLIPNSFLDAWIILDEKSLIKLLFEY